MAYGADVSSMDATPRSGKKTKGMSAVMAIWTASVAHQIAIQTKTAAALWASIGKPSFSGRMRIRIAESNPIKKPVFDFELFVMNECSDLTQYVEY